MAARPVEIGGDVTWRSLVVGPVGIPIITDVERAMREPHLAVLSGRPAAPVVAADATATAVRTSSSRP